MTSENESKKKKKSFALSDFEVGRSLGKGKFGHVYLARTKADKKVIALKVIQKEEIERQNMLTQLTREIEIHASIRHPNIIRLHAYFHDKHRMYLVLEHAPGGELMSELKRSDTGRLTEERTSNVMRQLVEALHCCHTRKIIHRDIKPENILVGKDGVIKLADFGWSVKDDPDGNTKGMKRQTLCGTLDYLPPEMVAKETYCHKIDTWMSGVLMFEMLVGTAPFAAPEECDTYENVKGAQYHLPPDISKEARDLLGLILQADPDKRIDPIGKILFHPWIRRHAPSDWLKKWKTGEKQN